MFQMPGSTPCKGETVNTEHYPLVADITHFDEPESKAIEVAAREDSHYRPEAIIGWCAVLVVLYALGWLAWHAHEVIAW